LRTPAVNDVTVTERLVVAIPQPPVPVTVYITFAVPGATAVSNPVEFTVNMAVFELDQTPPETVADN
jgi:hypothetical protein